MSISIKAMKYVSTAMRYKNIAAAAKELNVAASAVASAIDHAESVFGIKLVTRTRSRGIITTSAGREVLQSMEKLLEHYEAVLATNSKKHTQLGGFLKIGYYAPISPAFIPAILKPILEKNPQLKVILDECDNDQAQSELLNGNYDAILFVSDVPSPQIKVTELIQAPAYCLCSTNHPFANRKSVTLEDVKKESLVILNRPTASDYYRQLLETTEQTKLNIVASVTQTEMVRSMVGENLGCAILNMRPLIDETYANGRLACVPISCNIPNLSLSVGAVSGPSKQIVDLFTEACVNYFNSSSSSATIIS